MSLKVYVPTSTANPLGRRPWNYKLSGYDPRARYLSAYYRANFAVPNPNEIGARIDNPGLGASFNRPGGIDQAWWATRDNPGAPRPVYGPPETIPGHYAGRRLGIISPPAYDGGARPMPIGPEYGGEYFLPTSPFVQNSPQQVTVGAAPVSPVLVQPTLAPVTPLPATSATAISSSGQPMSTSTPAATAAAPAVVPGSIQDLYNQALTFLQSSSLISSVPNYVPVGAALLLVFMMSSRGSGKGRR